MIDSGRVFKLFDAPDEGRPALAMIEGSRLLDQNGYESVLTLDRDAPVVFQCHHGIVEPSAAEYCLHEPGLRMSLEPTGGIEHVVRARRPFRAPLLKSEGHLRTVKNPKT